MAAFTAQRLQTNASWAAQFTFTGVDLTGWVMTGRAQSTKNSTKHVDLEMDAQIEVDDADAGTFTVRLSKAEAASLGEGTIIFELVRQTPAPIRPVLRFTVKNHLGVAE